MSDGGCNAYGLRDWFRDLGTRTSGFSHTPEPSFLLKSDPKPLEV